jgi:flagellin
MSFRVNTNVNAMNALRNLGQTNTDFSKSITRLSTGLRINSAADDPAGLIISETFRAQLSSIDQAMRNSQDAINYAKTAEGAFDEVNRLLRDARSLAVSSANTGTLTQLQIQANQEQLSSIASSITRIAQTTQFGTKKLLDGTSGVTAAVTAGNSISAIRMTGTFGGQALTSAATVTLAAITAGTQASITSATFTNVTSAVGSAGSFTLNGVTFSASANTSAQDLITQINAATAQTGVVAAYEGTAITLRSTRFGSAAEINLVDGSGVIRNGGAGSSSSNGTDATAQVTIGGTTNVAFTGGLNGNDGITLRDVDGNEISLTSGGNVTSLTAAAIGQTRIGSSTFQIGANAGQTASFSLGNYVASQLGTGAVEGRNLANLDMSTASGATDAIRVIDKAIDEISRIRGQIGNFQRNVLESNIRSLGVSRENLAASESSIRDTDVAQEMTQYTKLQILQQAGMSVLTQANSAPQQVLNLLRG